MEEGMERIGVKQNVAKKEHLVVGRGKGCKAVVREVNTNPECIRGKKMVCLRYLGARLTVEGKAHFEVAARLGDAKARWYAFRTFFLSEAPRKMRILAYRAMVLSVLLSGLVAWVLSTKVWETTAISLNAGVAVLKPRKRNMA